MLREGHVGLSLLVFSLLLLPFGWNQHVMTFIILATILSSLPDWDQRFQIKHRAYTHNLGFGLLLGAVIGIMFGYFQTLFLGLMGFLGVLGGVLSHLLGDIIAGKKPSGKPWKLKPFKPFSDREIGYGIWKATNKKVNAGFLTVGVFSLAIYILTWSEALAP